MKYVRMKIKNEFMSNANYEAWIHYSDNEKERKIFAIINGIDENGYFQDLLGRTQESIIKKEFETITEAFDWLEDKCKELVIEELTHVSRRGKWAQEKIDCINNMGFQL